MIISTNGIKQKEIKNAIDEARRFLSRAEAARLHLQKNEDWGRPIASAKRASLDLTMALADLRKVL